MNYRHAFHAGNFADVFKHVAWLHVLAGLARKPSAFRAYDMHGGIGWYPADAQEAQRSPERADGMARLAGRTDLPAPVASLVELVDQLSVARAQAGYPGSPLLAQALLRTQDGLSVCELHPQDVETLRANLGADRRLQVHHRNAYEALGALLPPPERRGIVLIDPPFERPQEWQELARGLGKALARWPAGAFLIWYPLKDAAQVDRFLAEIANLHQGEALVAELAVADPQQSSRLVACGLLALRPPFGLAQCLDESGPWLAQVMAQGQGGGYRRRDLR